MSVDVVLYIGLQVLGHFNTILQNTSALHSPVIFLPINRVVVPVLFKMHCDLPLVPRLGFHRTHNYSLGYIGQLESL